VAFREMHNTIRSPLLLAHTAACRVTVPGFEGLHNTGRRLRRLPAQDAMTEQEAEDVPIVH
jgi:hypothetical protein